MESGAISLSCGGATLADDVLVGDLQFDTLDFNVDLAGGKLSVKKIKSVIKIECLIF